MNMRTNNSVCNTAILMLAAVLKPAVALMTAVVLMPAGCIYASRCLNTSSCLNASGCLNCSGCLNAGGSTDVFHTIALIISGRPRVPIVCAERIVISEAQVQHFSASMGNSAVRMDQILQTLLHLGFLPERMTFNKIILRMPVSLVVQFWIWDYIDFDLFLYKAKPTLIGKTRVTLITWLAHWRFLAF